MSESNKPQKYLIRVPLEEKFGEPQKGRMKVGSQILRHLSKGIYSSPEMAIKELISNAFDADATEVEIDTKSSPGNIAIRDNGIGMDYVDFDQKFTYISKSIKKGEDEKTEILHRPMIGRLGIGFIAVSELCDTMIISSAKRGSNTWFVATLDFSKFRDKMYEDADFNDISEFTLINYPKKNTDESYTHIELRNLTEPFKNTLLNIPEQNTKIRNVKKLSFREIVKQIWHTKDHVSIEKEYGPYWRFVMNLASISPVQYFEDGPIRKLDNPEIIEPIKKQVKELEFKVTIDGMELRKPYLFPTINKLHDGNFTVLEFSDAVEASNGKTVSYSGYMYSQDGGILVHDWRGLIVRVKNTSIGIINPDFLGYPYEGDSLYYKWTFGEIYIKKGLEEAMNIDRATFKTADPEYYSFIQSIHEKLRSEVFNSVQTRWRKRNQAKRDELDNIKMKWRKNSARKTFNKEFEIITKQSFETKPVSIDLHKRILELNPINEVLLQFPPKERKFLVEILIAVTIARERYPANPKKQDDLLLELLEDLGKKYPKPTGRVKKET